MMTSGSLIFFVATSAVLSAAIASETNDARSVDSNVVNTLPNNQLLHKLFKLLEGCGLDEQNVLRRVFLSGNATCNDGTPAGYYLRKSYGSKRWIIFLEGGWYCYDQRSCASRWSRMQHLMSSKQWPEFRNVGGILSPKAEENPFWWNVNHVFIPYCTSDCWSGIRSEPTPDQGFTFMGASIVESVIKDLIPLGLGNASSLLFAGSSAGGAGVMLNLERVQNLLADYPSVSVRGITDSGWFLDRAPYSTMDGDRDGGSVPSVEAVKKGLTLWHGSIPNSCASVYSSQPWRCFFGYRIYPTLKAPLFVFQWLFDEAQMTADNVGAPVTKQQWDYVHKMGDSLRNTFNNVTAVFAPSCISHSILTKRDWQALRIDETTLPQALHCWELATAKREFSLSYNVSKRTKGIVKKMKRKSNETLSLIHHKKRRRKSGLRARGEKKRRKSRKRSRHGKRLLNCRKRLVERCSWPQCNHSCPKLHNPFTGEEMDFIELLKSFGLDMVSVASALGVDMQTLNNMDHEELLNLLTQQAS